MSSPVPTEYVGARATLKIINRDPQLVEIHRAIQEQLTSRILYITADGGMGKTRLLSEVLARLAPGGMWHSPSILAVSDPVDLYHPQTHSIEGLARAIRAVLRLGPGYFAGYERQRMRFERDKYDMAGMLRELSTMREQVAQAFLDDLNRLSDDYRLVLAFDTAEKLLYETDTVQKQLELGEEGIAVLPWLLREFLPKLKNAVVLIAGRPKPLRLREDLRQALPGRLIEQELSKFEKDDALKYFDAVAEAARQQGQLKTVASITDVRKENREVIWYYTNGRPIMLSLMIDYVVVQDRLLSEVKVSVEEAQSKTGKALEAIQQKIEVDLVRSLQETGRRADDAIRALAWTRRGMDAELLARVLELKTPDGKWDANQAEGLLQEVRDLSFVKVRPADNRVFLHDKMYDLLQQHVLASSPETAKEQAYSAILKYYEEKVKEARAEVERLQRLRYEKAERPGEAVSLALADATTRLYTLMAEEVHYRLRHNAAEGFQTYYRYAEEAFWVNDENLDMQLRNELLEYVAEREKDTKYDGLSRGDVERDAALRWIRRNRMRAKHDEAIRIAHRLRQECAELLAEGGPLTQAELNSLEGDTLTQRGVELDRAEKLLRTALDILLAFKPEDEFQRWRHNTLLARAHNDLGFLYRVLGRFRDAIRGYQSALPLWRALKEMDAEQANTLNNLAWAYAEVGDFHHAFLRCDDGLDLRQQLGPRAPIAFSLNTIGLIQTRADDPHSARVHCERAWNIFRDLQQPRGVGLACIALAEALRRSTGRARLYTPEESAEFFRNAEQRAKEAVDIFSDPVKERLRLVEALNELGCVYREWARIRKHYDKTAVDPDRDTLVRRGEEALRRAIREAGEDLLYRGVDAQVNLAWLYYHINDDEKARREAEAAIARVPKKYHITEEGGLPERSLAEAFYWVQLAKAHLLFGEMVMRKFQAKKEPTQLEEAAKWYALSLEYNALYGEDFRDVRRGREHIYANFKPLNVIAEFPAVFRGIDRVTEEYKLPKPTRLERFIEESFGPRDSLVGARM